MSMKMQNYSKRLNRLLNEQFIMVYTMGKVGSTSVEDCLKNAYHTHTLYGCPPSPQFHIQKYGKLWFLLRRYTIYPLKRAMIRTRRRVKIITFYRDPKDRNPSMFMQDLPFFLSSYICDYGISTREENPELLLSAYKQTFPHDYPAMWVHKELARFTGIAPKDLMLGNGNYHIIHQGRYSVFIGRTEALFECLPHLAEFLDMPQLTELAHSNRSTAKWYAPIYKNFIYALRADPNIEYAEEFRIVNGYADVP